MRVFFRDIIFTIVIAALIVVGQRTLAPKIVVDGPSMNFTLHDGQQIVINTVVYKIHQPQRGDVIVFDPPFKSKEEYIKRVIGLPGESVEVLKGKVYIHKSNGDIEELDEPYIVDPAIRDSALIQVPAGEYYVMGDNRNNSSDSREGWTVPLENILGKAWITVWPPDDWGVVNNYQKNTMLSNASAKHSVN